MGAWTSPASAWAFDYQAEYELGAHEWRDLYLDYRQFKAVQVRGGAFKLPFGLEENTSPTNLDFVYRTRISARLAPGRVGRRVWHSRAPSGWPARRATPSCRFTSKLRWHGRRGAGTVTRSRSQAR